MLFRTSSKSRHHNTTRTKLLCESRGGRPGLSVLTSLTVSVEVKQHWTMFMHWSQFVPNKSRGGRPGLSVLTSLMVSVDVKQHWTMLIGTGHSLSQINSVNPTSEDMKLYTIITTACGGVTDSESTVPSPSPCLTSCKPSGFLSVNASPRWVGRYVTLTGVVRTILRPPRRPLSRDVATQGKTHLNILLSYSVTAGAWFIIATVSALPIVGIASVQRARCVCACVCVCVCVRARSRACVCVNTQ